MRYTEKLILNGEEYYFGQEQGEKWINDNIIAWYPLISDFNDHKAEYGISGTAYDGTPETNAIITTVSGVSKKVYSNQGYGYNSTQVTTSNVGELLTLNQHTIMFWLNVSAVTSYAWDWFVFKQAGEGGSIGLGYSTRKGSYVYRMASSSSDNPDGHEFYYNTSFQTGWHHIAGTYDGSTAKLYLDAVLVGSYNYNFTPYQGTTSNPRLLCRGPNQTYISDLYIYKAPLDGDILTSYFNSTKSLYGIS